MGTPPGVIPPTAQGCSKLAGSQGMLRQSLSRDPGAALFSTDISGKEVGVFSTNDFIEKAVGLLFFPFFPFLSLSQSAAILEKEISLCLRASS